MKEHRIITVTGMRDWTDRETIYRVLDEELLHFLHLHTVAPGVCFHVTDFPKESYRGFVLRHGVAPGADSIANEWGIERGVTIERFHAAWRLPGGGTDYAAGPNRNAKMGAAEPKAHKCCAFWDGTTELRRGREVSGTRDMIGVACRNGIPVRIEPPVTPPSP